MDQDAFNMSLRKFLKKVGITAQREIEQAVRDAHGAGRLGDGEVLAAEARITIAGVDLDVVVDGRIELA
ncbi:MAG: DUF6494 family protein [Alphaproteobacteria bacterium]|jgi:hypothetical protein|nr:DUF6494 family protein [Alphaproteobacteria bacterium]MDP6518207.1 DUF6494 family protein [Alphaproteobacteria bacterium]|tara:strand:- start:94 stop:300 length:207 start_codon:yes stop_codon:yes gene_type:complete